MKPNNTKYSSNEKPKTKPEQYVPQVQSYKYTGNKLFSSNPEKYKAIVQDLLDGKTHREIIKAHSVAPNTVTAIRRRESSTLDAVEQFSLNKMQDLQLNMIERLEEALNDPNTKISPAQLTTMIGILNDKINATIKTQPAPEKQDEEDNKTQDLIKEAVAKFFNQSKDITPTTQDNESTN